MRVRNYSRRVRVHARTPPRTDNPVGGPPNADIDSPREFKWSPIRLPLSFSTIDARPVVRAV